MEEDYNDVEYRDDEKPYRRFSQTQIMFMVIGFIAVIGLGVYFAVQYYNDWKEDQTLTVEELKVNTEPGETSYTDLEMEFARYGIEEPLETFVYNLEIPEEERVAIDPMYNDPYVGFEENMNLNASLFEVEDKTMFILYDPKTEEVHEVFEWIHDIDLSIETNKTRGEKSLLTKETLNETDQTIIEENKKKIEELNNKLLELFQEQTQRLEH